MDQELKVEQLKWPLYVLDEVIVAPCAGSSQFIRAPGFRAEGQMVKSDSSYSFQFNKMARPAGLSILSTI